MSFCVVIVWLQYPLSARMPCTLKHNGPNLIRSNLGGRLAEPAPENVGVVKGRLVRWRP